MSLGKASQQQHSELPEEEGMPSPFTVATLDQQVFLHIGSVTDRTGHQAGTWPTMCVTILPFTVEARGGGPTLHTRHTPLALPATLGHSEQWRVQAVCVVANVTVITEQQA